MDDSTPGQLTTAVADEIRAVIAALGPSAPPELVERLWAIVRAAADFDAFAAEQLADEE